MKQLFFLPVLALLFSCSGGANGEKPTKEDVTKAIKLTWEKEATNLEPKKTVTINDITFGSSETANYAQQLEGVPEGGLITNAKIDFTENKFHTNETQHTRRIMTAWVFKDKFNPNYAIAISNGYSKTLE